MPPPPQPLPAELNPYEPPGPTSQPLASVGQVLHRLMIWLALLVLVGLLSLAALVVSCLVLWSALFWSGWRGPEYLTVVTLVGLLGLGLAFTTGVLTLRWIKQHRWDEP